LNFDEACPLWNREIRWLRSGCSSKFEALRVRHYSFATERVYVMWVRQFILFHGKRHPAEMGKREVGPSTVFGGAQCGRSVPVLARLAPGQSLSVGLLYGSGLRVMECLRLRVGDLDFDRRTIQYVPARAARIGHDSA
jgi:integrase